MIRKEEIEKAAEDYYNEVKCLSDLSAFPIAAFKVGAEWADRTMIEKAIKFFQFKSKQAKKLVEYPKYFFNFGTIEYYGREI